MAVGRTPGSIMQSGPLTPWAVRSGSQAGRFAVPGPLGGDLGPRIIMMKRPPHFPQKAMTCWASAIASWLRVKSIVADTFTDQTLIDYYHGCSCVDSSDGLDGEEAMEDVFGEWRLRLNMSGPGISADEFDFAMAERLVRRHGHVVMVTTTCADALHAVVIFGIEHASANDPYDFYVHYEDPFLKGEDGAVRKHHMNIEYPIRFAVGLAKSRGVAACKLK